MMEMEIKLEVEMETITNENAAFVLGVTRQTIYNMQASGKLPKPVTVTAVETVVQKAEERLGLMKKRLAVVIEFSKPPGEI